MTSYNQVQVGFRIHGDWERPSPKLLAKFNSASSAQVADAMLRFGALDTELRPLWPAGHITGVALTVWCRSGDNLMMHKSLALAQEGDILVINTQDNRRNSGFGELMANTAVRVGVRAVIVDGTVRDVEALEELDLPVYARGTSPTGCDKDGPGEIGGAIACGGVAVRSGDIVVADRDGITVVPLKDAEEVAQRAQAQIAREEKRLDEIREGILFRPEIDEILRKKDVLH